MNQELTCLNTIPHLYLHRVWIQRLEQVAYRADGGCTYRPSNTCKSSLECNLYIRLCLLPGALLANCFAKETTRNYSENVNVKSTIRTLRQVQCSNGIILEHFRKINSVCPIETERQRSNAEEKRKQRERTHKRQARRKVKG